LKKLRGLVREYSVGQVLERSFHVIARMRNVRTDGEENQETRKNSQEMIERHAATLAENFILPAFATRTADQF
jgi:3-phosphoglycerate kinase